jgi:hypothetical protein
MSPDEFGSELAKSSLRSNCCMYVDDSSGRCGVQTVAAE